MTGSSEFDHRQGKSFLQAEGIVPLPELQSGTSVTSRFSVLAYDLIKSSIPYQASNFPNTYVLKVWVDYFGKFSDDLPILPMIFYQYLKEYISDGAKLLDLLQYLGRCGYFNDTEFAYLSSLLESEMIGYRFVGSATDGTATLVPISNEEEAKSNQNDYSEIQEFKGAQTHFLQAIDEIKSGHFRGSVAESISGVESILKNLSGDAKAPFGKALNIVAKSNSLHPSLKQGLQKIYGWTNSPSGMRHALSDESVPVDEAEARFMLSACLAFAAWLKRSNVT